jgi:S1-C subfamily serine protease
MEVTDLIEKSRSGVMQVLLEKNGRWIGFGSAFLTSGGVLTCSHNIRERSFDAFALRFEEAPSTSPDAYIRIDPNDFIQAESPADQRDFAYLKIAEPEFADRHVFDLSDELELKVGDQVLFMGFPFGMPHLTSHLGFVSSLFTRGNVEIIQIDGSVNGGNSGGPLLDLQSGKVVGIVTRAVTGFIADQFDMLIDALQKNQDALQQTQGIMAVQSGDVTIDPMKALRVSQAAMQRIAIDLRRSANVGIGYAYNAKYAREEVDRVDRN